MLSLSFLPRVFKEAKVFGYFFKDELLAYFAAFGANTPNPSLRNPGVSADNGFTPTCGSLNGPRTQ